MKIIVTGVKGQLGFDILRELKNRNYTDIMGIDIDDLDITNTQNVNDFFMKNNPDIIIHCAAYTAVDKAESNRDLCIKVNVLGTQNLVNIAKKYNSKFVYISTDYVFDGDKNSPYEISDLPNPKSVYGLSKYLGEIESQKHDKSYVVRISWVFGKNGNNFVKTMLKFNKENKNINVVNDQFGSPTYTSDLSILLINMIETNKYGLYHASNEGYCTWFELAKEIFELTESKSIITAINTSEYKTTAIRPKNSCMSKQSLDQNGFNRLPNWKDALKRFLKEIEVI